MQEIINNCIQTLKNNNGIIINYADVQFLLCDVKNDDILQNTNSSFKSILVKEDVYIEDYCGGVTPVVYDLIEFSNKNLFLQLTKLKNASENLKINEHIAMYHVPKDEFLKLLCTKYKKAIAIMRVEKEFDNSYYHVNLSSTKNPFHTKSIIRLMENGEIKVIEK